MAATAACSHTNTPTPKTHTTPNTNDAKHQTTIEQQTEKYGVFDCKPLAFLWAKFPGQYDESNTVMLDDLR